MKTISFLLALILFSQVANAGTSTIGQLPQLAPSDVQSTDSFPLESGFYSGTARLQVSDLPSTPAFMAAFLLLVPSQTGHGGDCLGTNGTATSWTACGGGGGTPTQEILSNQCNGSNTAFTLQNIPTANFSVQLYLDVTPMRQGTGLDYTISGDTITLTSSCAKGQTLYAIYSH